MAYPFIQKPPTRLVDTKDMTKAEWLDWRRRGIGGSDVAAIFGMNPYKSAYQCYQDKLGLLPEITDNNRMRFGRDFEDVVAKWFGEETGFKIENRYAIFQHGTYPWMLANIDRWIIGEKAVLECKTAMYMFQKEQWGETGTDEVPIAYLFQIYHYMIVFGVRTGYLAVIFTDTKEFRHYKFTLDEELAEHIITHTRDFWFENVVRKIEPAIVDMDDVISKYPNDTKASLVADDATKELCLEHERLRQQAKDIEKQQEAIKVKVGLTVGEHRELLVNDQGKTLAAFTTPKGRTTIDGNKLLALSPEIHKEVSRVSEPERSVKMRWQTLKNMVDG
jgi:putative phage-type endonuclease